MTDASDLPPAGTLRPFEAAARLASMSAAARELGITQPAISRHLAQLEAHLRQTLFERTPRGLRLTPAGRAFHAAVAPALSSIAEAAARLRQPVPERTLRLFAQSGFAQQWLAPRLPALRAAMPDLFLRLTTSDRDEELDSGDYDLAIRFGTGRWPGCRAVRLFSESVTAVCAPTYLRRHPALARSDLSPADLPGERLLHLDEDSARWFTWKTWFESRGVTARIAPPQLLYSSYPLLLQAALAGEGIALGWSELVADPVARGWLVALLPPSRRDSHGYFVCRREQRPTTPGQSRVAEAATRWFVEQAGGDGPKAAAPGALPHPPEDED